MAAARRGERHGAGARTIAAILNDRGHRTTTGGLWSTQQVLRALNNRTYLGETNFRGNTTTDSHESRDPGR
ncbi:recombinase family protein [Nocardia brasiliensis]|uniref:recombinase family protein n=1 Tax=Nocardia brasiliensis TaxID=37326 RepID=UPI0009DA2114